MAVAKVIKIARTEGRNPELTFSDELGRFNRGGPPAFIVCRSNDFELESFAESETTFRRSTPATAPKRKALSTLFQRFAHRGAKSVDDRNAQQNADEDCGDLSVFEDPKRSY
jgi:hypothetical protein